MRKYSSPKEKKSTKPTKINQFSRLKCHPDSNGQYRRIYDDVPPKMPAPPPPAPPQATKFNSKLLPFDSTVDLSDQDLNIIKFDKQIFRTNFILREFLRNSQTTTNYSTNFPIYENLCRGCGYGLFDAKGNLCKFCQYIIEGYIKDYSRNSSLENNDTDQNSENIYESLCDNCGKLSIDGICPICSKLKSKNHSKQNKPKKFLDFFSSQNNFLTKTLRRTMSRNSNDSTSNEINKNHNGDVPISSNTRKIEIIHNVDGYDNVFKTKDTFDLNKICEMKKSINKKLDKDNESPYGKLKKSDLSLDSSQTRTLLKNGNVFEKDDMIRSKSFTTLDENVKSEKYEKENKTLQIRKYKISKFDNYWEKNNCTKTFSPLKIPQNTIEWMKYIKGMIIDYQQTADDSINSYKNIPSQNNCDCCIGNKHIKFHSSNLSNISENNILFTNNSISITTNTSTEQLIEKTNSENSNSIETITINNLPVPFSELYDSEIKLNNLVLHINDYNYEHNNIELQYMVEEFKRNLIEKQQNRNLNHIQILHQNIYIKREEHCEVREIETYKEKEYSRSKRKTIYLHDQTNQSDNNNLNEVVQYNSNFNEFRVNENNNIECYPQFNFKFSENGSNILRIKNNNNISTINTNRNCICEKTSLDSEFHIELLNAFHKNLKKDYYSINNDVYESEFQNPEIDINKNLVLLKQHNKLYTDIKCLLNNEENTLTNSFKIINNNYSVNEVKNPIIEQINLKNLIISVTLSQCLNKIIISYDKNLSIFLKSIQNSQIHSKWNFEKLFYLYKKFLNLCEKKRQLKIMKKDILQNNCVTLNNNNIEIICKNINNNKSVKLNMDNENINEDNKILKFGNIFGNSQQNTDYVNFKINQEFNNEKEKLIQISNTSFRTFEPKVKPTILARSISDPILMKPKIIKPLVPPVPPIRQNSKLTSKENITYYPRIKTDRSISNENDGITKTATTKCAKITNRYGKIFHQLEEEEEGSNYGKIFQSNLQTDLPYGKIKEHSYGKLKPIPTPRKFSDAKVKTEIYANIPIEETKTESTNISEVEKKYKIARKAPAPPVRTSSSKLSISDENSSETKQLEQNIYAVPIKDKLKTVNNDDGIYQPIWQCKTVGNPRESYESSCCDSDITESVNESSYNDFNEWETDDEFMFTTTTEKNNRESNNNVENINNNKYNEKPKIVVNDDNISVKSSLSTTSTITGEIKIAGAIYTGNQIISKNSLENSIHTDKKPYRIVCILYSPLNNKLRAFIHDYQNILNNNNVNELFNSSSQLSLNSLKTNNNDSDIISITSQTSSSKSIASNQESPPPLPSPQRKIAGKRKPDNNSSLGNKLFIPDSVHAWKFMLMNVNYCDDEEDLYISEDEILKLKEIEDLPRIVPTLQRFKSVSSDNLLDIPAQDKKSITERFRNKLQRGVLKLNPKQIKETKKGKQFFRPIERSSLYLDDTIKPKYPIFGATLDDVEKDTCDCNVPRFVVVCITLIQQKDFITIDGIYRQSGNKMIIDDVKKKLTQSYIFESQLIKNEDIHTITGLLKLFFRELKTPLIPQEFYHQLPDNLVKDENYIEIKKILNEIPQPNKGTLKYILKHLTVVAYYSPENRMPASNLAIIWGPCILFADTSGPFDIARMNTLTKILIENYDYIFGDDERLVA